MKLRLNSNGVTTKKKPTLNTIDKILLGCAGFLLLFTIMMIVIFIIYQTEPDTLITSVFGLLGGEITLSFAIWYIKKRYARKYEKEDKENGLEREVE